MEDYYYYVIPSFINYLFFNSIIYYMRCNGRLWLLQHNYLDKIKEKKKKRFILLHNTLLEAKYSRIKL